MMNDAWHRYRIMLQVRFEVFPRERRLLTPPVQPLKNQSFGLRVESHNSSTITTDTIVLKVTSQLCPQRWPPILRLRRAAYLSEPYIHFLARLTKLLRTGLSTQCRITFTTPTPVMSKTQEVKGVGLLVLPVLPTSLLSV